MSVSTAELKDAFTVFADDYKIVGHPETPFVELGQVPNQPLRGERQYSVVQPPNGATVEQVAEIVREADVLLGCMDKDVIGPVYELLQSQERPVIVLAMAGGVTQLTDERQQALGAILRALAGGEDVGLIATNHDEGCGYLGSVLGRPFPEMLGVEPGSEEEARWMKSLALQGVSELGLEAMFPGRVTPAVVRIDRQGKRRGKAGLDGNFLGIEPMSLDEILNGQI